MHEICPPIPRLFRHPRVLVRSVTAIIKTRPLVLLLPVPEREEYMNRGFTLIESLITTLVLVTGLVAVASAFSYGSVSSFRIQQQTSALALVSAKLEVLRMESGLLPGHHVEYLSIAPNGSVLIRDPQNASYRRSWEV